MYIRIQFQPPMPLLLYCLERGVCVLGASVVCIAVSARLSTLVSLVIEDWN